MVAINRKPFIDTFREAAEWGEHDELPLLSEETDPQLYASRNTTPEPFFLSFEKDTMIVLMSGQADVLLKHPDLRRLRATRGDFVYIPARTPHQVIPKGEVIQYRFKAREAGREALTWYCEGCGEILASHSWDSAEEVSQAVYLRLAQAYNDHNDWRTCPACGRNHAPLDLAGVRWQAVAEQLTQEKGSA
jgi:hypothetical protein